MDAELEMRLKTFFPILENDPRIPEYVKIEYARE